MIPERSSKNVFIYVFEVGYRTTGDCNRIKFFRIEDADQNSQVAKKKCKQHSINTYLKLFNLRYL